MMPQELIQMSNRRLLVLRAGLPPVRGDKIVYWRERAFAKRLAPPPTVPPYAGFGVAEPPYAEMPDMAKTEANGQRAHDDLTLELVIPALAAEGLEPLPERGASDEAVEAWVERFIDASVHRPNEEVDHGR
jgi:type IV secretion system protein VirD4